MNNDLISRSALLADLREKGFLPAIVQRAIERAPAVDAVPVSKLEELRDYLYAEDLIFMRGLAELNKLIANCGAKMKRR